MFPDERYFMSYHKALFVLIEQRQKTPVAAEKGGQPAEVVSHGLLDLLERKVDVPGGYFREEFRRPWKS